VLPWHRRGPCAAQCLGQGRGVLCGMRPAPAPRGALRQVPEVGAQRDGPKGRFLPRPVAWQPAGATRAEPLPPLAGRVARDVNGLGSNTFNCSEPRGDSLQ
jgi:hypothetical protein